MKCAGTASRYICVCVCGGGKTQGMNSEKIVSYNTNMYSELWCVDFQELVA